MSDIFNRSFIGSIVSFEGLIILSILPSLYLQWFTMFDVGPGTIISYLNYAVLLGTSVLAVYVVETKIELGRMAIVVLSLYLFFVVYTSITLFWTSNLEYGFYKLLRLATVILWGLTVIMTIISQSKERTQRFFTALSIYATLYTLVAFCVLINSTVVYGRGEFNFILTARLAGLSVIGMGILAFYTDDLLQRIASLGGIFIATAVLLLTGTRTPIVSLFLVLAVIIVSHLTVADQNWSLDGVRTAVNNYWHIIAIGGTTSVALLIVWMENKGIPSTLERFWMLLTSGPGDSLSRRFELYEIALEMWLANPLLGHGIGAYVTQDTMYPHNIFLEVLAETGLIGFLLLTGILLLSTTRLFRAYIWSPLPEHCFAFSFFLYFVINSLVSGDLPENRLVFVLAGFVGLYSLTATSVSGDWSMDDSRH